MGKGGAFKDIDDYDFTSLVRQAAEVTCVKPGAEKASSLLGLWSLAGTKQEQDAILEGLSRDFLLSYPTVRKLCSSREVTSEVLARLVTALDGGTSCRNLAFLLISSPADLVGVLRRTEVFR